MTHSTSNRSRGRVRVARALWYTAPGQAELRAERLPPAPAGALTIETHYSGISRGTERLIWNGRVPAAERHRMRAPYQAGDFPYPVKYGYSAAGVVVDGPPAWIGTCVFTLTPHQDVFVLPAEAVVRLPQGVTLRRATLAANMETALNAIWDSSAGPGDKIVVVGAGIVGLLVTFLAARMPGTRLHVVDVEGQRRALVERLGAEFHAADPDSATDIARALGDDADVVFHTSASAAGLEAAIAACGFEATLVEMSWYGDRAVSVHLGAAFHAKRLRLISSQVGHVAASRRARWPHARRLETAAGLLDDAVLDQFVDATVDFADVPARLGEILDGRAGGLSPVIAYPAAT